MMEKEDKPFVLEDERKKIPRILNITNATAYKQGVKNALEIVKEQDKEFIKRLKVEYIKWNEQTNIKNWDNIPEIMKRWKYFLEIIDKLAGEELSK